MSETVKELRIKAKELSVKGYYKMKKAELIEAIAAAAAPGVAEQVQGEKVIFNPENTAISTGNSYSARVLLSELKHGDRVLDYGCGSGRNIKYIAGIANIKMYGLDITDQLKKEQKKYNELRKEGHIIEPVESNNLSGFDKILNSHVLNVIELDKVKSHVIKDIYNKLNKGGKAYFEVRTEADIKGAKTKEPYGQGYKIKKGKKFTYQEAITAEKMKGLLLNNEFKIVKHICNSSKHLVIAEK